MIIILSIWIEASLTENYEECILKNEEFIKKCIDCENHGYMRKDACLSKCCRAEIGCSNLKCPSISTTTSTTSTTSISSTSTSMTSISSISTSISSISSSSTSMISD